MPSYYYGIDQPYGTPWPSDFEAGPEGTDEEDTDRMLAELAEQEEEDAAAEAERET